MPIFKAKNENFFKIWTPEMAYVLGFFTADGNMIKNKRGAHFISIEIIDLDILEKIREVIGSNHKISIRKKQFPEKDSYRLQVGSKKMFSDLFEMGITPNKSKRILLPKIPQKYFSHFLRGYFDGDGCINFGTYFRKDRNSVKFLLASHFTSGSKVFLEGLLNKIREAFNTKTGFIRTKNGAFDLTLSTNDSKKLFSLMYGNIENSLFLERKYNKFRKALSLEDK